MFTTLVPLAMERAALCAIVLMLSFAKIKVSGEAERDGDANENRSCATIRDVPAELRSSDAMKPNGLDNFYQKYTEAYGIPVLSSSSVSDKALSRACYVLRFLLADREDFRKAYYKAFGRVAVIGQNEKLSDIPEYSVLNISGETTRGLGAVSTAPVTTAAEENILCLKGDTENDDILVKTLAIGILNLAAFKVDAEMKDRLETSFQQAMDNKKWGGTNANRGSEFYFGEGSQSFFDVNVGSPANIRTDLASYDPSLFMFAKNVYTCVSAYSKRCNSRENEDYLNVPMNCKEHGWE